MNSRTLAELYALDFGDRHFIMRLKWSADDGYIIITGNKKELKSIKYFPFPNDLAAMTRFLTIVRELEDIAIQDEYNIYIGDRDFDNEYWVAQDFIEGYPV